MLLNTLLIADTQPQLSPRGPGCVPDSANVVTASERAEWPHPVFLRRSKPACCPAHESILVTLSRVRCVARKV